MPLSIVNLLETATSADFALRYTFPTELILVGVELENATTICDCRCYLLNSGTSQACGIPESRRSPQRWLSEDIKIPVGPQQQLVADFNGSKVGDDLRCRLMVYVKDNKTSERMGWWQ